MDYQEVFKQEKVVQRSQEFWRWPAKRSAVSHNLYRYSSIIHLRGVVLFFCTNVLYTMTYLIAYLCVFLQFVQELARVAAPDGRILIVTWCHRDLKPAELSLSPEELVDPYPLSRTFQCKHGMMPFTD